METIVVTRHPSLQEYLIEEEIINGDEPLFEHVNTAQEVQGKSVIGNLPLQLAACAAEVTIIPLEVPKELRGEELTTEQIRQFAGEPETFVVQRCSAKDIIVAKEYGEFPEDVRALRERGEN